jgi:hypothetical protein
MTELDEKALEAAIDACPMRYFIRDNGRMINCSVSTADFKLMLAAYLSALPEQEPVAAWEETPDYHKDMFREGVRCLLTVLNHTPVPKEELIRDLVNALKPFATECNTWPDDQAPDDYRIKVKLETKVINSKLTVGDLRCARSALTRAAEAGYGETP